MDQNGWNQKVEDGEGVRAMHIDAPETDEGKREKLFKFDQISQFLDRILIEHIYRKNSLES